MKERKKQIQGEEIPNLIRPLYGTNRSVSTRRNTTVSRHVRKIGVYVHASVSSKAHFFGQNRSSAEGGQDVVDITPTLVGFSFMHNSVPGYEYNQVV